MELNISESNKKNVACFIHSTNLHYHGTTKLELILDVMNKTNFYDHVDFVYVNNIGMEIDVKKYENISKKIILSNYSFDVNLFENCTLKLMNSFCKINPNYKILYLHTKGVSYENKYENIKLLENVSDWVDFMLHCLVNNAESCIELLNYYNIIGCNYREPPKEKFHHFSGNFWWVNALHLGKLNVNDLNEKFDAEWHVMKKRTRFLNIHSCPYGHYENSYKLDQYKSIVESNIKYFKENVKYQINNHVFLNYSEEEEMRFSNIICFMNKLVDIISDILNKEETIPSNILIVTNDFIKSFFNFEKLNENLEKYNIKIVSNNDVGLKITCVKYGVNICEGTMIDITEKIKNKFLSEKKLFIDKNVNLNELAGEDPLEKVAKKLYLYYEIGGLNFYKVVDEKDLHLSKSILVDLNAIECDDNTFSENISANKDNLLFGKITKELKLTEALFTPLHI